MAEQAKRANIDLDKLVNGVIVTGGAAQLRNINKAFEQHFKDLNLRIVNTPPRLSVTADDSRFNQSGTYNVGLAIIETGEINCNGGERVTPQQPLLFPEEHEETQDATPEVPETPAVETPEQQEEPKPKKESWFKRAGKYLSSLVSDNE